MAQEFLKRIDEALTKGDFDTVELLFLEQAEAPEGRLDLLREAARHVAEAGERERAAELLADLVEGAKKEGPEPHLSILRQIVACVPHRQVWRRAFVTAFNEHHAADPVGLAYLRAADIPGARDVEEALARLDTLLRLREGAYVEHPGGWGIGRIREVSPLTGHIVVDLEGKKGHRVNVGAAATIFKPLAEDHFRALMFDRRAELERLIEEDHRAVVRLLLTSFGSPQGVSEIRDRLVPHLLPKERWSNWWSRARTALKDDPYLRLSGAPRVMIEIRREPVVELDELLAEFRESSGRKRLAVVRKFKARKDPEIRQRILAAIAALSGGDVVELERLLLRSVLGDATEQDVASFLKGRRDGPELLGRLGVDDLSGEALHALAAASGYDEILRYFTEPDGEVIGEAAAIAREKDPVRFAALLADIFAQPRRYVWQFMWLVSVRVDPAWDSFLEPFPPQDLLARFLGLVDFLFRAERREGSRAQIDCARSMLQRGRLAIFRALIGRSPREGLREIYHHVNSNRAIKEDIKAIMIEQLALLSPESVLSEREMSKPAPEFDRSVVYSTAAGIRRRQSEYRDLVARKIPEAIEEVGRAQAFGDLSENAEWTAALEKRDQLAARAHAIEAELKKARVITPELYREGKVSLGCSVTVRDVADNRTETWVILGPWDGDLAHGVLNYLSPVGSALLGHRAGEEVAVTLPERSVAYEIVAVSRAALELTSS